jgi:cytochrome c-type biogenesis protein CcmH/NrfF
VAQLHSIRDDLYLVVGSVNPQTHVASFQIHVNPLVGWIWFGCIVLIFGSIIGMWPQLEPEESRVWSVVRSGTAVAASVTLGIILALMPVPAFAQGSSSHAGVVEIRSEKERDVFKSLRCMCGGCQRLPLADCACGDFAAERTEIRREIDAGMSKDAILAAYVEKWGQDGLTVPPNRGALRAIYLFPLSAIAAGGVGLAVLLRRWRRPGPGGPAPVPPTTATGPGTDEYDARLDEELKDLDEGE